MFRKILPFLFTIILSFSPFLFAQNTKFEPVDIYSSAYIYLLSSNKITISGNANLAGNLFSNSDIDLSGNSTITGNLFAAGSIFGKGNSTITGTSNQGVNALTLPVLPDKSYYQSLADESISPKGIYKLSGEINKIIFIDGDVILKGDLSGTGTIIATGDIKVINAKNTDKLSLISYSDIKLDGSINFTALCYAAGSIKVNATGNLSGSLVADSIKIAGNTALFYKPLLVEELIPKMEERFNQQDWESICNCAETLAAYGSSATSWLTSIFQTKEKDPVFRKMIAEITAEIKDTTSASSLISVLADETEDEYIRAEAAFTLGDIGGEGVYESLSSALSNPSETIRSSAAFALGFLGDKRATDPLINLLSDSSSLVRMRSIMALGRLGDSRAVEPLIALLSSPDEDIKIKAVLALGDLGDQRAVPYLSNLLTTEEMFSSIRIFSTESLGKIGGEKAILLLLSLLEDKDELVILEAAKALGEMKELRAIQPLKTAITRVRSNWVKSKLEEILASLEE